MRNRTIPLLALAAALSVAWAAGALEAESPALTRMSLEGRSDELPFSHVIVAGETIYVAGTIGIDPETGLAPDDPRAEARLALDGIRKKLALAGATMDDLVMVQVFCPDLELYETFNEVYATYFEEGYPTRAFVGSGPLLRNGRFEINGIAVKR